MFYTSSDKNSLICEIEVNDQCVTLFGRVRDDNDKFAPQMQDLIKAIDPDTEAHFEQEERDRFHPEGSPKKVGKYYFHHVHSKHDLKETLRRADPWMPEDLRERLNGR